MSSPPAEKPGDAMLMAMWAEWHEGAVAMATNDELSLEWSMLSEDYYSWDDSDLQLAAELGKTLLERNKELETGLKQQQTVIDDQSQEIEYLSKQSVALREVNDSRLRVYEQLEVSIQELEVTNQRLTSEATRDKKRIRSLCQTVEGLEARVAELQAQLDELRAAERDRRAAEATEHASGSPDQGGSQQQSRLEDLMEQVARLERQLSESRERERRERERRRTTEAELSTAQEEGLELRQEMAELRERSVKLHSLAEEVHAMEESRLSPFLRQCTAARVCGSSPQMAVPSIQEFQGAAASLQELQGAAASLQKLQGAATSTPDGPAPPPEHSVWGSQSVVWPRDDTCPSPAPEITSDPSPDPDRGRITPPPHQITIAHHGSAPASLISDLDAHYRVLLDEMDKYEWMLFSRQPRAVSPQQPSSLSLLQELQMSADGRPSSSGGELRMSSLDGTQVPLRDSGPDSLMLLAASSDGDASSSGFSEGSADSRTVSRATQTPEGVCVPTAMANVMVTSSDIEEGAMTSRMQHIPQYKRLFQEIYEVLKRPPVIRVGSAGSSASSTGACATELVEVGRVQATRALSPSPYRSPSRRASLAPSPIRGRPSSADSDATTENIVHQNRAFSYTEEFEKCLQKASAEVAASPNHPARKGGASEAVIGGDTVTPPAEPVEEFPFLARPSEEVTKLWILERSYAEALKAGRRCLHRPTLL